MAFQRAGSAGHRHGGGRPRIKPAGIFLSNGPGDPAALDYVVRKRERPV